MDFLEGGGQNVASFAHIRFYSCLHSLTPVQCKTALYEFRRWELINSNEGSEVLGDSWTGNHVRLGIDGDSVFPFT